MCIDLTGIDRPLETCEALVAEQKTKIRQLEEDLQQQRELCQKLEAQLKAVENAGFSGSVTELDSTEGRSPSVNRISGKKPGNVPNSHQTLSKWLGVVVRSRFALYSG
ncbi:hypothetical protein [Microcoleus vaginatus]|uniref:hypothetical protein n=1 Tax=Microcoleus vaginatus TaxID=119532 RepID=UPI00403F8BB9